MTTVSGTSNAQVQRQLRLLRTRVQQQIAQSDRERAAADQAASSAAAERHKAHARRLLDAAERDVQRMKALVRHLS